MKLGTLLLIMAALQLTLILFGERYDDTPLMILVLSPFEWSALNFFLFFGLLTGSVAGITALVGTLVFGKTDLAVFAGAVSVFIGCCIPILNLWSVINREIGYLSNNCVSFVSGEISICSNQFIASLVVAPLAIGALITIINWWRSASDIN